MRILQTISKRLFLIVCVFSFLHSAPKADSAVIPMRAFNGMDIKQVLEYISDVTGYSIIIDPAVRGRVSISSSAEMTVGESLELIKKLLYSIGYTYTKDDNVIKVIKLKDLSEIKDIYTNIAQINQLENRQSKIITYIRKVNTDGTVILRNIKQYMSKYGSITYDNISRKFIITDFVKQIIQLEKLIKEFDVGKMSTDEIMESIVIKNLSLEQVGKILGAAFKDIDVEFDTRYPATRITSPRRYGEKEKPKVRIVDVGIDDQYILAGEKNAVKQIKQAILEIDGQFKKKEYNVNHEVIKLKGITAKQAENFLSTVTKSYRTGQHPLRGTQSEQKTLMELGNVEFFQFENVENLLVIIGSDDDREKIKTILSDITRNLITQDTEEHVQTRPGSRSVRMFMISHSKSGDIIKHLNGLQNASKVPGRNYHNQEKSREILDNDVVIINDEKANSIIVKAYDHQLEYIESLIGMFDKRRTQVLLEVKIMEVTYFNDNKSGVDYGNLSLKKLLKFTGDKALQGLSLAPNFGAAGIALDAGSVALKNSEDNILFNFLTQYGYVNIISTPNLLTLDNKAATLDSSTQKAIAIEEFDYYNQDQKELIPKKRYEYKTAGLTLDITPHINNQENINLEIKLTIEDFKERENAGNPDISSRKITSEIILKNNATAILGGIIKEKSVDQKQGIPGLMRIPLLGRLFSRTVQEIEKSELIIFITPRVLSDDKSLEDLSAKKFESSLYKSVTSKKLSIKERWALRKSIRKAEKEKEKEK